MFSLLLFLASLFCLESVPLADMFRVGHHIHAFQRIAIEAIRMWLQSKVPNKYSPFVEKCS
jgi:hypothetical protein